MRQVTVHHDMADTVGQVHGVTSIGNLRDTQARCLSVILAEDEEVLIPWDRILLIEDEGDSEAEWRTLAKSLTEDGGSA